MAAIHGKSAYFKLGENDLSSFLNSANFDRSTDTAEVSTFGDDSKKKLKGLRDANFSLEGIWDATLIGYLNAAYASDAVVAFEYGPAGNGNGAVKYSGNVHLVSIGESTNLGAGSTSVTLEVDGDVGVGTFST